MTPLLEVRDLRVEVPLPGERALRTTVRNVSFDVGAGEAVGLVGESGSGKSMTARAVLRLLPERSRIAGTVRFDGVDVLGLDRVSLRAWRSSDIGVVFQDPHAHVNPMRTVGDHLVEGMLTAGASRGEADRAAVEWLDAVRVPDAAKRLRQYPHELSGGMLQRVMLAGALMVRPRLLLADEPTTALDTVTQAEVMAVLAELQRDLGLGLLFITHDLDLAATACSRTVVLYGGSVMEVQPSQSLHDRPMHPYTAALVAARPLLDRRLDELPVIPGTPVSVHDAPTGCPFAPRCDHAAPQCTADGLPLLPRGSGVTACVRHDELHGSVRRG